MTRWMSAIPGMGTPRCKSRFGPALSVGFRGRRPGTRGGEESPAISSVEASPSETDEFIEKTLFLWESRARRALTREDARRMVDNVVGFFDVLAEWLRAESLEPRGGGDHGRARER